MNEPAETPPLTPEQVAVRKAGFTDAALAFPRDELCVKLLRAFNGVPENWPTPLGWRFFPNAMTRDAWLRVTEAAREHFNGL